MKYLKGLLMILLLITLVACGDKEDISYNIIINEELSKIIEVGDDIDFKEYFIITDSNGNNIEVIESMLDLSNVKLDEEGSFVVRISYEGIEAEITFQVELPPEELTYTITVNDELPTTLEVNSEDVDFKKYFVITDSLGNNVTVLDEMVDSTDVNLNEAGSYVVKISFEGVERQVTITVELPPEELTYTITVNDELPTTLEVNSEDVDFKKYFVITDSLGNNVTVLDEMVDSTDVNLSEAGSYVVKISFEGLEKQVTITVELPPEELTYTITVNDELPKAFDLNSDEVDFKKYFVITDSLGNDVTVLDEMVDSSDVNLNEAGSYVVKISFEGLQKQVTITVELPPEELTYTITVNDELPTTFDVNSDEVDFKKYFIITDSKGNNVTVLDEMVDSTDVDFSEVGSYVVRISFEGLEKEITITVLDNTPPLTYEITINQLLSTDFTLGDEVDFKEYFVITDSLGNNFDVLDSMLDLTNVNLNEVGTFIVTLTFKDVDKSINFEVKAPDKMFAGDLFISEYSEGKNYNKYIEIFNGTGESVDLTNYKLKLFNDGNTPAQYEFELSGTLKDGEIYVVYNSSANATIKDKGSVSDVVISFNGNDPIALYKNDVLIDVVGNLDEQVSDGYDIGSVVDATKDNTIIRKPNVYGPNDTWTESEWLVLGLEDYSNLGIHEMAYYEAPLPEEEEEEERVPDLYISEYFEGSGLYIGSKYIEIYNGLDHDVDLSAYALQLYAKGELEPKYVQALSGILNPNDVYIVYAPYSLDEIKEHGDLASEVAYFNGRHAIALTKNDILIDVFGVIGEYPETNDGWFVDDYSGTANNTLIRHYDVTAPTTTWNKDEWYSSGENYLYDIGQHMATYENQVIEDFDDLYGLIAMLELDAKGTATSSYSVTIKGTVYMDVENETKLVYITDGKSFIKLHGDKMHNYTAPNTVYEITGNYKAYQFIPTFEVSDTSNIKALDEEPVSNVKIKEVSLEEILNLEKENFKDNIINGYLQSMIKVTGYLQLDDHNSSKWDYALTVNETYTKNNTQYINNGLYFKNNVEELDDFLIDYEVHPDFESIQVDIYGVIYDWNPDRKNWRIYVASHLTLEHLDLE